jgi:hypothetical protein
LSADKTIKIKVYKIIISAVVFFGSEHMSLTLREEHGVGVFENRMLRRIFGPKRNEVTRGWRKLHNEEFHNMHFSSNVISYGKVVPVLN